MGVLILLTYIQIKNYLTVDFLELSFKNGMTAITGETGSGKSVLIGALNLTLGVAGSSDLIAKKPEKLEINSFFNIEKLHLVKEYLEELDWYEGDELVLRRIITADGKNKCFINNNICKVSDLKKLSELLLNFHDQNQQQNLIKSKRQIALLDEYCDNKADLIALKSNFNEWKESKEKLANILKNFEENNSKYQLLTYQLNEIVELDIKEGEFEKLETEFAMLSQAESVIKIAQEANSYFDGEENIVDTIKSIYKKLSQIKNSSGLLDEIKEMIDSAYINLKEASSSLESYIDNYEINPERMHEISERIDNIVMVANKHKLKADDLLELQVSIEQKIKALESRDLNIEEIEKEVQEKKSSYIKLAKKVHLARENAIPVLTSEINKELENLHFNKDAFSIKLVSIDESAEENYTSNGIDKVDFYIRPNLGKSEQLLSKAASGGELSRISLVLELVSSRKNSIPTLVFDEVDSGVGGETGDAIGTLLRGIGEDNQIFVITHLPQVAAKGQNHIHVKKTNIDDITYTVIEEISDKERVREIARMLGGGKLNEQESLAYAKNLL